MPGIVLGMGAFTNFLQISAYFLIYIAYTESMRKQWAWDAIAISC